jgi:hypothetical protein
MQLPFLYDNIDKLPNLVIVYKRPDHCTNTKNTSATYRTSNKARPCENGISGMYLIKKISACALDKTSIRF